MDSALKHWSYGDSGAFAEFATLQFPGGMGRDANSNKSSSAAQQPNLRGVTAAGTAGGAAAASSSSSALMIVQTGQSSLVATKFTAEELAKPDDQQVQQLADQTARDLDNARRRAAAIGGGTVAVGRNIAAGAGGAVGGKRTEVIQEGGRIFAVTEKSKDISEMKHMHLEKVRAGISSSSSAGGQQQQPGQLVQFNPDGTDSLIRSETRKFTAQERAAFALPKAVYSRRNPKSVLIDTAEREKHDARNYTDHTVSSRHAEAAQAMQEAVARAEEEDRQRGRDAERERQKREEEQRERDMQEAKALLARAAESSSNQPGGGAGAVLQDERARENRRKIHQLQRSAAALGLDVEDLLAQDDDVEVEIAVKTSSSSKAGFGGAYDSRLGHALTHDQVDEGFFGSRRQRDDADGLSGGNQRTGLLGSALGAAALDTVNMDRLDQEQRLQETLGNNRRGADMDYGGNGEDEDDDVFGVKDLL